MSKIIFFNDNIESKIDNPFEVKQQIENLFKNEKVKLKKLTYIFCSDAHLSMLNRKYLNHNTLTDILTFPLSDVEKPIEAEIYISIDRVKENAKKYNVKYQIELLRVIIHGALHLCDYSDKTKLEQQAMRAREDYYLNVFNVPREADN